MNHIYESQMDHNNTNLSNNDMPNFHFLGEIEVKGLRGYPKSYN